MKTDEQWLKFGKWYQENHVTKDEVSEIEKAEA